MNIIEYTPIGVCAKKMIITIDNNIVNNIEIIGGCPGNALGISALCKNQNIDYIISKLENIKCGFKNSSCPDQLAKALIKYKKETV